MPLGSTRNFESPKAQWFVIYRPKPLQGLAICKGIVEAMGASSWLRATARAWGLGSPSRCPRRSRECRKEACVRSGLSFPPTSQELHGAGRNLSTRDENSLRTVRVVIPPAIARPDTGCSDSMVFASVYLFGCLVGHTALDRQGFVQPTGVPASE